ncbi:MAG: DNA (cytosine-5-)-methyltransferase [Candidatus Kapaibacteriota bacterium]|jgi:DNA (cytosine-5)-methyltransferase 1
MPDFIHLHNHTHYSLLDGAATPETLLKAASEQGHKAPLTVLDTFAGAGGFSLGFALAGYTVGGAIEIDKWAAETFQHNHPESQMLIGAIEQYSDEEIKEKYLPMRPNILLGGPPCQGFSIANKQAGDPNDPRNSLFMEFVRIARLLEPQYLILENVPNIVKSKNHAGEFVIDILRREIEALGYIVYHSILDATHFGVPQIRKRFFLIASRHELLQPFPSATHTLIENEAPMFGSDKLPCPTLWDAISDMPVIEAGEGSEEMCYSQAPQTVYQEMLRHNANAVHNHKAMKHSKRMVERFAAMSWGDSVADVPEHLRPFARNSNGKISDKVYDQNNRRMYPHKPCHTIPASFYANFVHPYLHRNFTAREGARIQSFPDWYVFKGKPTVVSQKLLQREERTDEKFICQYSQIGNAVPPLLAKAIAQNLLQQIKQ